MKRVLVKSSLGSGMGEQCWWKQISISTDRLSRSPDTILVDCDDFHVVTCVNVSLCDWVNDVLGSVLDLFLVLRQNLYLEVMPDELVVKNRGTKLWARALYAISERVVRSNGIIAVDDTLATLIDAAKQVECIIRHEATAIKSYWQLFSNACCRWGSLVLHLVLSDHKQQVFVQSLDVSYHASGGQDRCLGQLGSLRLCAWKNAVACRHSSVGSHRNKVSSRNRCKSKLG